MYTLSDSSRDVSGILAHHYYRNREEDPVTRQFPLIRQKLKDDFGKTYNNAGSLWIDCTTGSAMVAEYSRKTGTRQRDAVV